MDFYASTGDVVCHLVDNQYFFLWDGKAVAYIAEDRVFAYNGRQLGWFENGWLYDRANQPALFSPEAHSGPPRPARKVRPVRGGVKPKPARAQRQIGLTKGARTFEWSPVSSAAYFDQ